MVQIKSKLLINLYDFLLKYHESKLTFKKELLTIKTEELTYQVKRTKDKLDLKTKDKLSKYEALAGIKSDYINEIIDEQISQLEDKIYWKKRVISQKIKRATNDLKKEKLNGDLSKFEVYKKEQTKKIIDKYLNSNPSETDKLLYEEKKKDLLEANENQKNVLERKYTENIKSLNIKTNKETSQHQEKMNKYIKKIEEIESQLKDNENTVILDQDVALSLRNLSMHFGGLKAVDELSFNVKKGEIFGLIGPNGAGKTTVFNCITRFYKPTSGDMYFNNSNNKTIHLNEILVHNIIKEGIVRTFQNVELVWELNILDNLLVAAHSSYRSNFFGHAFHSSLTKREEEIFTKKATKILKDLNLTAYTYAFPIGLPYGILKKVELARTLMSNPKLIILDEPAAGLNDSETKELAKFIKVIRNEYNVTIFLVEHDMGLVMSICDTVCAISFGKKLALGTPKEVQNSKVVQEAYLGGD
jgi:branched-chain amino acid transport system ATP-binding protein